MQIAPPTYCHCNNIFFDMNFIQVLNPSVEFRMSFLKTKHATPQNRKFFKAIQRKKMLQTNTSSFSCEKTKISSEIFRKTSEFFQIISDKIFFLSEENIANLLEFEI